MTPQEAIQLTIDSGDMIVQSYLSDLSDADFLVRAVPGINHIAWQMGHLIASERQMVDEICPGVSPPLPDGFAARHSKETAGSDDASKFLKKSEYMALYAAQRAATLKALHSVSAADLDKPAPEKFREYLKSVGDLFSLQGTHWVMHAGQWAVLRRKLGRPPLF